MQNRLPGHLLALTALVTLNLLGGCSERTTSAPAQDTSARAAAAELRIDDAWAQATAPGAKVGAAYLTLHNPGPEPVRITGIRFAVAGKSEIHDMQMADGMMRMRALESLDIPPGESVALKSGGAHVMLMHLQQPLVAGDTLEGSLALADGRELNLQVPVLTSQP